MSSLLRHFAGPMSNERTPGDHLFERYLRRYGYDFEYEPDLEAALGVSITTQPDYVVARGESRVICEVKHFAQETAFDRRLRERAAEDAMVATALVASDKEEYGPIRSALRDGAKNLRQLEEAGVPLVIVLTNPLGVGVDLDPFVMQGAILGSIGHVFQLGESGDTPDEYVAAGKGGVLARDHGYVSAVGIVTTGDAIDIYETGDNRATPIPGDFFERGRGDLFGYLPDGRYGVLRD